MRRACALDRFLRPSRKRRRRPGFGVVLRFWVGPDLQEAVSFLEPECLEWGFFLLIARTRVRSNLDIFLNCNQTYYSDNHKT